MQYITANGQITVIEVVESGPTLGTKLPSTEDQGVEHAKSEQ